MNHTYELARTNNNNNTKYIALVYSTMYTHHKHEYKRKETVSHLLIHRENPQKSTIYTQYTNTKHQNVFFCLLLKFFNSVYLII